jgi:radical SAM protein with 4Fe4S-binding SPASM domain
LSRNVASTLKDLGVGLVQVSIDGEKDTHNKIRRRDWAYDKAVDGIKNCREYGIHVTVSNTLMRSNLGQIESVVENAIEYGANGVGFQTLVPNPKLGIKDPEFLDCYAMKQAYEKIAQLREKHKDKIDVYKSEILWHLFGDFPKPTRDYQGGCSAGFGGLSVLSDGTVYACRRMPIPIGNIREGIVKLVTEKTFMQELRNNRKEQGKSCDTAPYCGGCRAIAYATTGNPFGKDPTCFKHLL